MARRKEDKTKNKKSVDKYRILDKLFFREKISFFNE